MMAVWPSAPPSSVATPAMRAGRAARHRPAQRPRPTRMAPSGRRQAAEGRRGQVAHQPAGDLAHLVGAALQAGLVVVLGVRQDQRGDRLGLVGTAVSATSPRSIRFARRAAAGNCPASAGRRRAAGRSRPGLSSGSTREPGVQLAELLAGWAMAASSRAARPRCRRPGSCGGRRRRRFRWCRRSGRWRCRGRRRCRGSPFRGCGRAAARRRVSPGVQPPRRVGLVHLFIEAGLDQGGERVQRLLGVPALGFAARLRCPGRRRASSAP